MGNCFETGVIRLRDGTELPYFMGRSDGPNEATTPEGEPLDYSAVFNYFGSDKQEAGMMGKDYFIDGILRLANGQEFSCFISGRLSANGEVEPDIDRYGVHVTFHTEPFVVNQALKYLSSVPPGAVTCLAENSIPYWSSSEGMLFPAPRKAPIQVKPEGPWYIFNRRHERFGDGQASYFEAWAAAHENYKAEGGLWGYAAFKDQLRGSGFYASPEPYQPPRPIFNQFYSDGGF